MLLLFPDYATAARTLSESDLDAGPPGDHGPAVTTVDGGLFIDPLRLDVTWNGIPLRLTRLERAVLAHLAEAPLRAWSHEHLYRAAWGDTWLGDASALHATVKRLRRKLRDAGATIFLVPASNCAEALMGVPAGLRLVKVTNVDDALSGMAAAVAGRPAPTCTS